MHYDLNSDLIDVYKTIQNKNCKDELFNCLFIFINEYDKIKKIDKKDLPNILNRKPNNKNEALKCKENYYYWIRSKYNSLIKNNSQKQKDIIEKSAMFIFLNKTGFRGMYRVGPNGFNIPYGNYKKTPKFFTKNEFNAISDLIKDVKFICCHFNESFENIRKDDFIYLDPPYAPVNKKSFVKYTKNGFTYENHLELFGKIKKISQTDGVKLLMSNSKVKLVEDNFTNNGLDVDNIFNIEDVIVRRAINSKNPAAKAKEVLIWN